MFGLFKRGPVISPAVLADLGQEHPRTPDYHELSMRKEVLVFVGDEMMKGHRAELDKDYAERYGVAFTEDSFLMFKKNLGKMTYPVIMPKVPALHSKGVFSRASPAPIKGELWKVQPEFIVALDNFKENGDTFSRHKVTVRVPFRPKFERNFVFNKVNGTSKAIAEGVELVFGEWHERVGIPAFMYLANPEYFFWEAQGDPDFKSMKMVTSTDKLQKPYYEFADVNGFKPHQPHQPNMVPHVAIKANMPALKKRLLQNHIKNKWFLKQQTKRADEAAQLPAK